MIEIPFYSLYLHCTLPIAESILIFFSSPMPVSVNNVKRTLLYLFRVHAWILDERLPPLLFALLYQLLKQNQNSSGMH